MTDLVFPGMFFGLFSGLWWFILIPDIHVMVFDVLIPAFCVLSSLGLMIGVFWLSRKGKAFWE